MKQLILLEVSNWLHSNPHLKRKFKLFALVGVIGVVFTFGLLVWAGVSAVGFVGNQVQTLNVQSEVDRFKSELGSLPTVTLFSCWDKAQSLMNLESWRTRPASDNFNNLKLACLETKAPPLCVGDSCIYLEKQMNTAKGEPAI